MIIGIPGNGLERILFQIIEKRTAGPVSQVNHQLGIVTVLLTDRLELIRYATEMSIGHNH